MVTPTMPARIISASVAALLVGVVGLDVHADRRPAATAAAAQPVLPSQSLTTYCITCHNSRLNTAGLALDTLDVDRVAGSEATWEKVVSKLRTQEMPPPGRPRPDQATYRALTAAIESRLDAAAAVRPKPGRVAVHRLNRAEYTAAIRDLLGLEVDGKALLPADDADQEGFDNVASVLSVSPLLLENYLSAARRISRLAVGDPTLNPVVESFKISKALVQDDRMHDGLPFGSRGGALIRHYFPLDAEYSLKVLLRRQEYDYIIGMGERHQIDFRVDGRLVKRFAVGGEATGMPAPENFAGNTQGDPQWEAYMHTADAGLEVRVPVTAGEHEVGVSFVARRWEAEGVLQPPQTGFGRTTNEYYFGNPAVEFVMIGGPFGTAVPGDSPTRRAVFTCTPKDRAAEAPCARHILSALATRAYRRPVTNDDLHTLMGFYQEGRAGRNFDAGIQRGLERILAAPSFIFRVERAPTPVTADVYRLSDLDLASRLSFFLWGSLPDPELLQTAVRGQLADPVSLERQLRRMLGDPRSQALIDNFATRWLELNKLAGAVPDTELYAEFDENLRDAMEQETRLFVASQIQADRPVGELLSANYSFLNERLAAHYGVPNVYGSHYRRHTFTDGVRGGLLGQASILTLTSYGNRTSVVMRGRWVLANLLGAPPPQAPPDVPALREAGVDGAPRSLRDRMQAHRSNPVCASCHRRMDPIGFALENFDAIGKWRIVSDGERIDASGALPDGARFDGVGGLRALVASHQHDFVRTVSAKLLAYAIGRGLESYDQPVVRTIARQAAQHEGRWSAIINAIVTSTPFQMATRANVSGGNQHE